MSLDLVQEAPHDGSRLLRTLAAFRATGHSDMAFGGPVVDNGNTLAITGLHSAQTRSLQGLDRKSTLLNSSHVSESRMPSSA